LRVLQLLINSRCLSLQFLILEYLRLSCDCSASHRYASCKFQRSWLLSYCFFYVFAIRKWVQGHVVKYHVRDCKVMCDNIRNQSCFMDNYRLLYMFFQLQFDRFITNRILCEDCGVNTLKNTFDRLIYWAKNLFLTVYFCTFKIDMLNIAKLHMRCESWLVDWNRMILSTKLSTPAGDMNSSCSSDSMNGRTLKITLTLSFAFSF
jgi:hypothetical protein